VTDPTDEIPTLHHCNTCGADKTSDHFYRYTARKSGYAAHCKDCARIKSADYYQRNRERTIEHVRAHRVKNNAVVTAGQRARYYRDREEILEKMREHYAANRERIIARTKAYYEANKEKHHEQGKRWRLPRGHADFDGKSPHGLVRVDREICTERDLLNAGGTFFEFPAENAGGIAKVRPVATHNRQIHDYATWRGLLVMSGIAADAPVTNSHLIRSTDNRAAVWVGTVDDLWCFGKPTGVGGPWKETAVTANMPSDPYLLTGYDRKKLSLSHTSAASVRIRVEVDPTGTGRWVTYATFDVPAGKSTDHVFPAGYQAYWLRVSAATATTATALLVYN